MRPWRGTILLLALAWPACGDALAPGSLLSKPLFSFNGTISPQGGLAGSSSLPDGSIANAYPTLGLLWTDPFQIHRDLTTAARSLASSVNVNSDTYAFDIFAPPPAMAMWDATGPTGQTVRVAFAEIVLFDDRNRDGTFQVSGPLATITAPDLYLGGSAAVLTYTETPNLSADTSTPVSLLGQMGYATVNLNCDGQVSRGATANSTNVQLQLQPSLDLPEVRSCLRSHSP